MGRPRSLTGKPKGVWQQTSSASSMPSPSESAASAAADDRNDSMQKVRMNLNGLLMRIPLGWRIGSMSHGLDWYGCDIIACVGRCDLMTVVSRSQSQII